MPTMPKRLRPAGARSQAQARKEQDDRRGSAASRGYTSRWSKAAATFRRGHPLCEYCSLEDRVEPSTLVDHLYPHRTYDGVFWRVEWWVASCASCHSGMKQAIEAAGKAAIDALARRLGREPLT
ncbi:hypothetical protein [Sphingobium bisphenolivorans]|uniref:hypothetical protein n=1 Tax=Sphingobium bisphenolivorans TaxID=1335760 RepID=UPI0003B6B66C|nr:hypothetical protein [Sphingobium bisphenolivorans]